MFTAIELPEAWRGALAQEAQHLENAAPGFGRWVNSALLHLTLVFLGYQPPGRLPAIQQAIDDAAARATAAAMRPGKLGSFGNRREVRVLWAGVQDEPPGALARIQQAVATALSAADISFDDKPFRPHLTIARARRDAGPTEHGAIQRALAARPDWGDSLDPDERQATCQEIVLIKSNLRPTGPIYTPLHRAVLRS